MPKIKPALLNDKVGDIIAVGLKSDCFCYLHKHLFGYGVLPFLSATPIATIEDYPSMEPCLFVHLWVDDADETPMTIIAHIPFSNLDLAAGRPAFMPPDLIEPYFKVHGVFNGLFAIRKPVHEEDLIGLEAFVRHRPAELAGVLLQPNRYWRWISEGEQAAPRNR